MSSAMPHKIVPCISFLIVRMINVGQATGTPPYERPVTPSRLPNFYHTSFELRRFIADLASSGPGACPGMNLTRAVFSQSSIRQLRGEEVSSQDVSQDENVVDVVRIRAGQEEKQVRLALMFGEHGRELITVEVGMQLLKALCGRDEVGKDLLSLAQKVLSYTEFLIFPNVDESGRRPTEKSLDCKRDNFEHVDLNRNWAYMWSNSVDSDAGSKPFSEPETSVAHKHVESFHPNAFLSVHSGDRAIWLPGAYDTKISDEEKKKGGVWEALLDIAAEVNSFTHCNCRIGAPGEVAGIKHPGTSLDYVAFQMNVSYTMAWEIWYRPSGYDATDACIPHFSPERKDDFQRVLHSWTIAILYYAESVKRGLEGHAPLPIQVARMMHASATDASRSPLVRHPRLRKRFPHDQTTLADEKDDLPTIEYRSHMKTATRGWTDGLWPLLIFICLSACTLIGARCLQKKH